MADNDNSDVNSGGYWDTRFATDWETLEGPQQSQFFSRLAVSMLPPWLDAALRSGQLSLADWGCAQGDGTRELASGLGMRAITGIDFSPVAIEQARRRYPDLEFVAEDWLTGGAAQVRFDVVFSSNTLEHFERPHEVLERLSRQAAVAVVLLLPWREFERHAEHFVTFEGSNVPVCLAGGQQLAWAKVTDCARIPDARWGGEQVLLVYADPSWLASRGLMLDQFVIELTDIHAERQRDLDRQAALAAEQEAQHVQVAEQLRSTKEELARRQLELNELRRDSTETRRELMRVSEWAARINARPFTYGLKRLAFGAAKRAYHGLPISQAAKQKLRSRAAQAVRSMRGSPGDSVAAGEARAGLPWVDADAAGYRAQRDVFVFSVIDWHFRIQRPQHLARGLARRGHRVFFLSNAFADSAVPGYRIERLDDEAELFLVRLHVAGAPPIYFAPPSPAAQRQIRQGLAMLIAAFGATSSTSIVQHPYWFDTAAALPNSQRVYDCMDHHEGFGNVPQQLIDLEKRMLRESDLVVVTSDGLETFAREYNDSVAVVRNAGEYDHFAQAPADVYRDAAGRKIIGYYGAIAEWFDVELVRSIARAHAHALVLLVGNDTAGVARSLASERNVQFTGEVPYSRLPHYLHAFDVCLLPFKVLPLTLATNPVKVYEYLAAGKPVVCVDLPEVMQFGTLVDKAADADRFVEAVSGALADPGSAQLVEARRSFAKGQTWDHRVRQLDEVLGALPWPRISAIVLTYNNLDFTKACIESVLRETDYPNFELIVVDNMSTDDTRAYLKDLHAAHPEIRVILNERNLGFAAGNNVGLAAATGDYLVILNNDTVVTRGWALTLLRHLQHRASAGLAGPVTNNIGNEARVATTYTGVDAMKPEALRHTLAHMGEEFRIRTAAFFCVMLTRQAYEQCGPLCEEYGVGFFEDDDYCRRLEAEGLRVECAQDVFVHHHLSASFNKLPSQEKQALFERNKGIYESKWGPWVAHAYRAPDGAALDDFWAQPTMADFAGQEFIWGSCNVCSNESRFCLSSGGRPCDSMVCSSCRANTRDRSIALGLLRIVADRAGLRLASLAQLPGTSGPALRVLTWGAVGEAVTRHLQASGWITVVQRRDSQPAEADGAFDVVLVSDLEADLNHDWHRLLGTEGTCLAIGCDTSELESLQTQGLTEMRREVLRRPDAGIVGTVMREIRGGAVA